MTPIRITENFWDRTWTEFEPFQLDPVAFRENTVQSEKIFLNLIGEVHRKDVLDIGCGNGLLSIYLAQLGARVTAIDTSPQAVKNTEALAETNRVDSLVEAAQLDARDLKSLGKPFDVIVGKFILHHIEPFDRFSETLFNVMKKEGRGIFFENNARNPILIFSRTFLAGKFGIPKYGDIAEYPFEPREIEVLKQRFDRVSVHYPVFMFFGLMGPYLFGKKKEMWGLFFKMDEWIYRHWPMFHQYSYHQIIELRKSRMFPTLNKVK